MRTPRQEEGEEEEEEKISIQKSCLSQISNETDERR